LTTGTFSAAANLTALAVVETLLLTPALILRKNVSDREQHNCINATLCAAVQPQIILKTVVSETILFFSLPNCSRKIAELYENVLA
jgi:hypothetical protein